MTFYVAQSTYPSSSFYEEKVHASPGEPALLYLSPTSQGIVFCSYEGSNDTGTEIEVETGEGGKSERHSDEGGNERRR